MVNALHTALHAGGPVAIRYPRGAGVGAATPKVPVVLEAGRAEVRRVGSDVALLAVGRMVPVAETAADLLQSVGVSASVVNMRWVKPLDHEVVSKSASEHRLVVTIEENVGAGGFGAAVAESLTDLAIVAPLLRLALPDCFVTHGATSLLLADVGLTPEGVRDAVVGRLREIDDEAPTPAEDAHDSAPSRRRPR